ncbi:hypothetical protein MNV49_007152 [Pseudohyphozyma bogoriensis]|nr:hypothetical protein MNV49_007152 [Pseudohyphozyma bogoriensis]
MSTPIGPAPPPIVDASPPPPANDDDEPTLAPRPTTPGTIGPTTTLGAQEADPSLPASNPLSGKRRRPFRQRKKLWKHGDGWEVDRVEPKLHEKDVYRYDPVLPYDQRLLRAVDEWRSLRAIPPDVKLNFDSLLAFIKCDVYLLRLKYGRQALRGFTPTLANPTDPDGEGGPEEENNSDKEEFEMDDKDEEAWASRCLTREGVAKWLEDRSNDGYTPTLTFAPAVLHNFLTFLLVRRVFPLQTARIKACLETVQLAKDQLAPNGALFKALKHPPSSLYHSSLSSLFPSQTSALSSPLTLTKSEKKKEKKDEIIADVVSAGDFGEEELEADTRAVDLGDWAVKGREGDGGPTTERENGETTAEKARIELAKLALEANRVLEAWKGTMPEGCDASRLVRDKWREMGVDVEEVGVWKVGYEERSARVVKGFRKLAVSGGVGDASAAGFGSEEKEKVGGTKEEKEKEHVAPSAVDDKEGVEPETEPQRDVAPKLHPYLVHLSPHQADFPLTTFLRPPPAPPGGPPSRISDSDNGGNEVLPRVLPRLQSDLNVESPPSCETCPSPATSPPSSSDKTMPADHSTAPSDSPTHTLNSPIDVVVHLQESQIKNLIVGTVWEADWREIVFVPVDAGAKADKTTAADNDISSSSSSSSKTLTDEPTFSPHHHWILTTLHRILPSYYPLLGSYLLDEPGKQREFPGGWGPALDSEETKEFERRFGKIEEREGGGEVRPEGVDRILEVGEAGERERNGRSSQTGREGTGGYGRRGRARGRARGRGGRRGGGDDRKSGLAEKGGDGAGEAGGSEA